MKSSRWLKGRIWEIGLTRYDVFASYRFFVVEYRQGCLKFIRQPCLYRSGFYVGKYISLEAKIAKNKDLYYEVLGKAQNGWHEGEEDVVPFIKYLLGTILAAYKDFEDRFEIILSLIHI